MSSAELAKNEILMSAGNRKYDPITRYIWKIHRDLLRNLATNTPVVSSEH